METNYKQRTLKSIEELIEKYEAMVSSEDLEDAYVEWEQVCPLCEMYRQWDANLSDINCWGCVSADKDGRPGCINSTTYKRIDNFMYNEAVVLELTKVFADVVLARRDYWTARIKKVTDMPEEWFEKDSRHYFDIDNI